MRYKGGIAVAVLLSILTTQPTSGAATSAATGTATTGGDYPHISTTMAGKRHRAGPKTVRGTVTSVDDTDKSFVFHPKTGTDSTLKTNDTTSYRVGKKKGTWADVKAGTEVTVTYKNDGTDNWAIRVKLSSASAAGPAQGESRD